MPEISERLALQVIDRFLEHLRQEVEDRSLKLSRLPGWVKAARIRFGWVNDSLVAVFEGNRQGDAHKYMGRVGADTVVLLDMDNFTPTGVGMPAKKDGGALTIEGAYQKEGTVQFNLAGERLAFSNCGLDGYHGPLTLLNLFFNFCPGGVDAAPVITRFVPLALYIHQSVATSHSRVWDLSGEQVIETLARIHDSDVGDFYEGLDAPATTFEITNREIN